MYIPYPDLKATSKVSNLANEGLPAFEAGSSTLHSSMKKQAILKTLTGFEQALKALPNPNPLITLKSGNGTVQVLGKAARQHQQGTDWHSIVSLLPSFVD